ncbi:hypothetical protein U1Q18_011469 [Sarracenia purpurea var. burkii]
MDGVGSSSVPVTSIINESFSKNSWATPPKLWTTYVEGASGTILGETRTGRVRVLCFRGLGMEVIPILDKVDPSGPCWLSKPKPEKRSFGLVFPFILYFGVECIRNLVFFGPGPSPEGLGVSVWW